MFTIKSAKILFEEALLIEVIMPKYIKWVEYKAEQQPWLNELMSDLNMEIFLFLAQGKTMSLSPLASMHSHTT